MDDCPPLPPLPQANKAELANNELELPSGQDTPPKSLKQIQDFLESSSAPDLLEVYDIVIYRYYSIIAFNMYKINIPCIISV